jgi:hypothetical protein
VGGTAAGIGVPGAVGQMGREGADGGLPAGNLVGLRRLGCISCFQIDMAKQKVTTQVIFFKHTSFFTGLTI